MANMTAEFPNIDQLISDASNYGCWRAMIPLFAASTTAATVDSGKIIAQRFGAAITVPTVDAAFQGYVCTVCQPISRLPNQIHAAFLEYNLGTLTVSGSSWAAGVTMPTKPVRGSDIQTATHAAFLVVETAVTATTPTITITYVNQDGTGSRTATMVLPTNPAVKSAYKIDPYLQAGDTGIQEVTNVETSTGSAGTMSIRGGLFLGTGLNLNSDRGAHATIDPIMGPLPVVLLEPGEIIAVYVMGGSAASTNDGVMEFVAVPETV